MPVQILLQLAEIVAFAAARVEDGDARLAAISVRRGAIHCACRHGSHGHCSAEIAGNEFVDLASKWGIVATGKELTTRLQHFFRITGCFFEQQIDILLSRNIEGVVARALQHIAASGQREGLTADGAGQERYCSHLHNGFPFFDVSQLRDMIQYTRKHRTGQTNLHHQS